MKGPDIICPGTYKCGTTWLFEMLRQHPDIFIPDFKEFHYFSTIHGDGLWESKSIDWYYDHFPFDHKVSCDISPGYLIEPDTAQRIAEHVPEARFICVFRDPVIRAHSHYYYLQKGKKDLGYTFNELLENPFIENNDRWNILGHGMYAHNLEPYLELFDREKFLFIFMEDISEMPEKVLEAVFNFTGVDPTFLPDGLGDKVNAARGLKSKNVYWLTYNIATFLERTGLSAIRKTIKKTGLPQLLSKLNTDTIEKPELDKRQIQRLLDIYRQDTAALKKIVDRDLDEIWINSA